MGRVRARTAPARGRRRSRTATLSAVPDLEPADRVPDEPQQCGLCRREGPWQNEMRLVGVVCDSCAEHVHAQARRAG
ncbi:MAG TPA: hypothetical protein VKV34_06715 [Thermoleophilia bacterium]|nr:hypothetical protein [Thermoleophilia bacterium]